MLQIQVPGYESFDEANNTFLSCRGTTLRLEHSLISLSKWEAKWKKPFLGKGEKTLEECMDYVRCMTLTQNVDPLVYRGLTPQNYEEINQYIEAPMTATWFSERERKQFSREVVTAEIIYYWMISLNIPFECQKWHLNRLLTLVRVCNAKNAPTKGKKGGSRSALSQRAALNRARRAQMHSNG